MLNRECQKCDASFKDIKDECINLTELWSPGEYPFHIDIEEQDVKLAIKDEKVKIFVLAKAND